MTVGEEECNARQEDVNVSRPPQKFQLIGGQKPSRLITCTTTFKVLLIIYCQWVEPATLIGKKTDLTTKELERLSRFWRSWGKEPTMAGDKDTTENTGKNKKSQWNFKTMEVELSPPVRTKHSVQLTCDVTTLLNVTKTAVFTKKTNSRLRNKETDILQRMRSWGKKAKSERMGNHGLSAIK